MKRLFAALVATLLAAPALRRRSRQGHRAVRSRRSGRCARAHPRGRARAAATTEVVVENLGGAGGLLAVDRAASAAPDGRTILSRASEHLSSLMP